MNPAPKKNVTNIELKNLMEERWRIQDNNADRLAILEPTVANHSSILKNHDKILNGDPGDRNDQGIVGLVNDIASAIDAFKGWMKPLAVSLILWAVLGGLDKLLEVVNTVDALAH